MVLLQAPCSSSALIASPQGPVLFLARLLGKKFHFPDYQKRHKEDFSRFTLNLKSLKE